MKTKTKEHKKKISEALMGHKVSEETRRRISMARKGKPSVRGVDHGKWKGGRITHTRGYILKYCPEHPNACYKNKAYVFEHRLIMEKHLGRYLTRDEVVHHKNGKLDDNRIENLSLFGDNKEHLKDGKYIELVCAFCGEKFLRRKSYVRGRKYHYCNMNCMKKISKLDRSW